MRVQVTIKIAQACELFVVRKCYGFACDDSNRLNISFGLLKASIFRASNINRLNIVFCLAIQHFYLNFALARTHTKSMTYYFQ